MGELEELLERAVELAVKGNLAEADGFLQRARNIAPTDLRVMHNSGMHALLSGNYSAALECYWQAIRIAEAKEQGQSMLHCISTTSLPASIWSLKSALLFHCSRWKR